MRNKIELKNFNISVQASKGHYCKPREDNLDLDSYTHVEIALFDKNNNWVQPRDEPLLQDFPRLAELLNNYESGDIPVGAFISMALVQDLITYLEK